MLRTVPILCLLAAPGLRAADKSPTAIIKTSMGDITIQFFDKLAPNTVRNFIDLATGRKEWTDPRTKKKSKARLYDGTSFHRILPGQLIQGGDPAGTGFGNPGFTIRDEIVATLKFDRPGRVAMANSGPNTSGCQFFITDFNMPSLNEQYTIFGQVTAGMEVVRAIQKVKRLGERPRDPVIIHTVQIIE